MRCVGAALLLGAWLGLVGCTFGGCAVVLDASSELGNDCRFDSDDETTCGQCVAEACQAEVNACCGDEKCAPALSLLDGCSDGDEDDCDALFDADEGAEALGQCMKTFCPASCAVGEPVTFCAGDESHCFCDYDDGDLTNETQCSVATTEGGLCCADIGWPDTGLECTCENLTCKQTGDGCECGTAVDGPLTSCTGTFCCATTYDCTCGPGPCDESSVRVDACSIEIYKCNDDQITIDACSAVR